MASTISLKIRSTAVSVEWQRLYADCSLGIRPFNTRYYSEIAGETEEGYTVEEEIARKLVGKAEKLTGKNNRRSL